MNFQEDKFVSYNKWSARGIYFENNNFPRNNFSSVSRIAGRVACLSVCFCNCIKKKKKEDECISHRLSTDRRLDLASKHVCCEQIDALCSLGWAVVLILCVRIYSMFRPTYPRKILAIEDKRAGHKMIKRGLNGW